VNYYQVLDVGRHQSMLDVRKSYKVMSRKYHPDKNPDDSSQIMFQQIKTAYDVREIIVMHTKSLI
jgi:DnaJ-related protein SCJ1